MAQAVKRLFPNAKLAIGPAIEEGFYYDFDTEVMFREEDVDYQVGDYVYHETFGTGKVVEVTNTLVSVAFKHPHGIKKLMKNHKKLSKV